MGETPYAFIRVTMANNFFLNQDPLLFQQPYRTPDDEFRKQYNDALTQYKSIQQKDYLGELDRLSKGLNDSTIECLKDNDEYNNLKTQLMLLVQDELLANIKWRINSNPSAVKNIEKQTEIINSVNKKIDEEQRKNISEINDYMKNYSDMTFDEYKEMKKGNNI